MGKRIDTRRRHVRAAVKIGGGVEIGRRIATFAPAINHEMFQCARMASNHSRRNIRVRGQIPAGIEQGSGRPSLCGAIGFVMVPTAFE